jgi:hypothetical protein
MEEINGGRLSYIIQYDGLLVWKVNKTLVNKCLSEADNR